MIRVLVVDDHVIVRNGLEQLLETVADIELVGTAGDGEEALRQVKRLQPDVVLMDLSMPVMDGVQATQRIATAHPDVAVVILTSFGDQTRILDAVNAGAVGYLLKHADPEEILNGIRAAYEGGSPLDPKAARVVLTSRRTAGTAQLTEREQEVLQLLSEGLPNKTIARRLGITERTVKAHLTSIFQRLGVTDRTQAALWARNHLSQD
ncbi:MAG: response regulator transcription factor [Acidimicrobiia bacterium]|nr:response regulator transcription factor [Acidimicrobiia bacterium]